MRRLGERRLGRHLITISALCVFVLAGLTIGNHLRTAYALPPGNWSIWSDVIVLDGQNQWDDQYATPPYIVGTGCTEADYYDPDYDCYVVTTVTAPDGASAQLTAGRSSYCSMVDVYLQVQGAVGTYDVVSDHYTISNLTGGEEYIGCTHPVVTAGTTAEHYFYNNGFYYYQGYGRTRKACWMPNCPSNSGKVCYNSITGIHSTEANQPCPTGIVSVKQKIKRLFFWTVCVEISHADFYGPFSCP